MKKATFHLSTWDYLSCSIIFDNSESIRQVVSRFLSLAKSVILWWIHLYVFSVLWTLSKYKWHNSPMTALYNVNRCKNCLGEVLNVPSLKWIMLVTKISNVLLLKTLTERFSSQCVNRAKEICFVIICYFCLVVLQDLVVQFSLLVYWSRITQS